MARLFIRSFPQSGFGGVFTPGRYWPSDGITVETVDTDEDPPADPTGPLTIGKVTLQMLRDDKRFAVGSTDIDALKTLEQAHAEVKAENESLKARIAELEGAQGTGGNGNGKKNK